MIEIARAYGAQGMRAEAEKAMSDAQRDLAGTLEEGNVAVRGATRCFVCFVTC
jgi:hypothetical protein